MDNKKKGKASTISAEIIAHEKKLKIIIAEYERLNDKLDKVLSRIKNRKNKECNN